MPGFVVACQRAPDESACRGADRLSGSLSVVGDVTMTPDRANLTNRHISGF